MLCIAQSQFSLHVLCLYDYTRTHVCMCVLRVIVIIACKYFAYITIPKCMCVLCLAQSDNYYSMQVLCLNNHTQVYVCVSALQTAG